MKKAYKIFNEFFGVALIISYGFWLWFGYHLAQKFTTSEKIIEVREEFLSHWYGALFLFPLFIASFITWIYFPAFIFKIISDVVDHKKNFLIALREELNEAKNTVIGVIVVAFIWLGGAFFLHFFGGILEIIWFLLVGIYAVFFIGSFLVDLIKGR